MAEYTDTDRINFIEAQSGLSIEHSFCESEDRDGNIVEEDGEFSVFTFGAQWVDGKTLRKAIDKSMDKIIGKKGKEDAT